MARVAVARLAQPIAGGPMISLSLATPPRLRWWRWHSPTLRGLTAQLGPVLVRMAWGAK